VLDGLVFISRLEMEGRSEIMGQNKPVGAAFARNRLTEAFEEIMC